MKVSQNRARSSTVSSKSDPPSFDEKKITLEKKTTMHVEDIEKKKNKTKHIEIMRSKL